ncbi:MAG TPA: hypothetical protein VK545_24325 [Streptomyces sp.]|nr:hypothetical protein [Streptomyces sp.]
MTISRQACACGEDQIPWMLARFGLLGVAVLVLGMLVVMLVAGWGLATVVWLVRRRRPEPGTDAPDGLRSFDWSDREP